MHRCRILLRLLLCLALVLNGLTPALAGGRMAGAMSGPAMAVIGASPSSHHCDVRQTATATTDAASRAHILVGMHQHNRHGRCCAMGGTCTCGCTPLAQAVLSFAATLGQTMAHAPLPTPTTATPAAPALPNLLRPPIA